MLKRLCMLHAIREDELDQLLRRHVFVDLHQAVRQAMRIGLESYGLKKVETAPGLRAHRRGRTRRRRGARVRVLPRLARRAASAGDRELQRRGLPLDRGGLRLAARPGARRRRRGSRRRTGAEAEEEPHEPSERELLREQLVAGEPEGSERWLAGELLAYHSRAAKQQWWAYFQRKEMTQEQLLADGEALAGLELRTDLEPIAVDRSLAHPMSLPAAGAQGLERATDYEDPESGAGVSVHALDEDARRRLDQARDQRARTALPRAAISDRPAPRWPSTRQRSCASRISVRDRTGAFPALERLLRNDLPVISGRAPGATSRRRTCDELRALARGLDKSTLVIQGPPGTGKTYTRRAPHHRPRARGQARRRDGVQPQGDRQPLPRDRDRRRRREVHVRRHEARPRATHDGALIKPGDGNHYPDSQVIAATSWLFAREDWDGELDYLVIDEAGQFALADAIACGTSARNLILLGDPSQLARSCRAPTRPARMRARSRTPSPASRRSPRTAGSSSTRPTACSPTICSFISSEFYDGRLHSHPGCAERSTSAGTGLRLLTVEHVGNSSSLEGGSDGDRARDRRPPAARPSPSRAASAPDPPRRHHGRRRPTTPRSALLRAALPEGVRVGTVDRFQGQEAPIVFFSMASSSGEDAPRDAGFLFSRNRLNVALSRAQSLAILVCSPRPARHARDERRRHAPDQRALPLRGHGHRPGAHRVGQAPGRNV